MTYYRVHEPQYKSDYEFMSKNGTAYTSEQAGYFDILRKGYPKPSNPNTILAELYSPNVPPVLWATLDRRVSFLVTDAFLKTLKAWGIEGFLLTPVEITKVAVKGRRKSSAKEYSGEPEDMILKRKNVLKKVDNLPTLWGIEIVGEVQVEPLEVPKDIFSSVMSFKFTTQPSTDLFQPVCQNRRYGSHCSERFKTLAEQNSIENFGFTPISSQ